MNSNLLFDFTVDKDKNSIKVILYCQNCELPRVIRLAIVYINIYVLVQCEFVCYQIS